MTITRLQAGPRMSQAVVHGATIYLAGQVADQAKGKSVGRADNGDPGQDRRSACRSRFGQDQDFSATIYLADIATFAEMNAAWEAWVASGHTPARATVEAKLAAPEYTVEIVCVAARTEPTLL